MGSTIVVDPHRGVIRSTGTVEVRLGPIYLARRTIDWRVAAPLAFSVVSAGKDPDPRDNTVGGLAVKGSIGMKFAGGQTVGTLSAALPGPFAGLTTDITVVADNQRGLVLDGLTMVLDGTVLGPAEVRDAKLVLSSEGGGRWEGGATFFPSKIQAFSVAGVLGFGVDGYLKLGGAVDGLNKPLVGGVFWQRARSELTFNPFSVLGGLGVTYGPQIKLPGAAPISAASLDADFKYTDGDPASFQLNGTGRVVNATFSGGVKVTTDGAVDANGALQWKDPIVDEYGIDAKIAGWYEQGAFDLSGSASLVLPGFDLGGEGVVSSAGIAGCRTGFGPSFGFGYRWRTRQLEVMASSCGIEPWRAARPSGGGRAAQVGTAAFRVRGGRRTAVFSAIGTTAAPKITLTGPGVRVDTPPGPQDVVSTAKALLFQDQAQRTTYVAIDAPKGGTYHLAAAPGSSPVATYRSAEARVAVHITARTRRAGGGRRTLTYRARNLSGGSIAFVEEGKGLRRVLARRAGPAAGCASSHRRAPAAGARSARSSRSPGCPRRAGGWRRSPPAASARRARSECASAAAARRPP
ncbi:MAG TPA: hypothetical protein VFY45_05150 [Baekduia sp.]|nr:hypothetical protein [Baekduia sp.]